jgi:hypothetical protein
MSDRLVDGSCVNLEKWLLYITAVKYFVERSVILLYKEIDFRTHPIGSCYY